MNGSLTSACVENVVVDLSSSPCNYARHERDCEGDGMNLVMVLHLLDLNRNSYDTLARRTGLSFMKRHLIEGKGRQRFSFAHAVALGSVLAFQSAGVDAQRASAGVAELFGPIDGFVASAEKTDFWLTIINFVDGTWGWASGAENADTFADEGEVASKVSINLLAVWRKMASRFGTPMTVQVEVADD